MQNTHTFEAMPQNLAALSEQVSGMSVDITAIKKMMSALNVQPQSEEFITVDEACNVLHIAKPTLYKLCQRKEVPHYKPSKELLFRKSELVKWVEASRSNGMQTREEMEAELRAGNRRKPKSRWC